MNESNNTNVKKDDIVQSQAKIIAALRHDKAELIETNQQQAQRIEILERRDAEYKELMEGFGNNGNLTYYQVMEPILTRRNAAAKANADRINYERQAKRDMEAAAKHDADVKAVLEANPNLQKYCDERKVKIEQAKETMLKLAKEFYVMPEEKLRQYITIPHKPDNSAIKHLINEITEGEAAAGGKQFVYYECNYCNDRKYSSLADIERHCWNEGEDHHDVNLKRINTEAFNDTAKANTELQTDIDNAIRGKKDAEYKAGLARQRAEQSRLKTTLPFAKIT